MELKQSTILKAIKSQVENIHELKNSATNQDTIEGLEQVIFDLNQIIKLSANSRKSKPALVVTQYSDQDILDAFFAAGSKMQWVLDTEAAIPGNIALYNAQPEVRKPKIYEYGKEIYDTVMSAVKIEKGKPVRKRRSLKYFISNAYELFYTNHADLYKESLKVKDGSQNLKNYLDAYMNKEHLKFPVKAPKISDEELTKKYPTMY